MQKPYPPAPPPHSPQIKIPPPHLFIFDVYSTHESINYQFQHGYDCIVAAKPALLSPRIWNYGLGASFRVTVSGDADICFGGYWISNNFALNRIGAFGFFWDLLCDYVGSSSAALGAPGACGAES